MNEFPKAKLSHSRTGCCPEFEPELWDGKKFIMDNMLFVKAPTKSFMFMPLNMDKVMTSIHERIDKAGASPKDDYLTLSHDSSPWKAQHYFHVTQEIEGLENVRMSGKFLAKVFEGPYSKMAKWMKETVDFVKAKGENPADIFAFYTTCPKCSKVYGKNYVVLLAKLQ